eukprot:2045223-Amphidinium_carterae.1
MSGYHGLFAASVQADGSFHCWLCITRLSAMIDLQANCEVARIREWTSDEGALKDLLRLSRVVTARRHLAMASRFGYQGSAPARFRSPNCP